MNASSSSPLLHEKALQCITSCFLAKLQRQLNAHVIDIRSRVLAAKASPYLKQTALQLA
jgi:hypothetical protein